MEDGLRALLQPVLEFCCQGRHLQRQPGRFKGFELQINTKHEAVNNALLVPGSVRP